MIVCVIRWAFHKRRQNQIETFFQKEGFLFGLGWPQTKVALISEFFVVEAMAWHAKS